MARRPKANPEPGSEANPLKHYDAIKYLREYLAARKRFGDEGKEATLRAPGVADDMRKYVLGVALELGMVEKGSKATKEKLQGPPDKLGGYYLGENELEVFLVSQWDVIPEQHRSERNLRRLVRVLAEQLDIPLKPLTRKRGRETVPRVPSANKSNRKIETNPGLDQLQSPKREAVADAPEASQERILAQLREVLAEAMPLAKQDAGLATKVTELLDEASSIIRGDINRTLGKKEAAEILELSEVRVLQLAQRGRIGKKIAGQYRFSHEELEAFKRQERKTGVHLDAAK